MKTFTKLALSVVALFGFAIAANAEQSVGNATPVVEPEWAGKVYLLSSDGELLPLESQIGKMDERLRLGGFGGGKALYTYHGFASPVRLKMKPEMVFVMRLETQVDPASQIFLNQVTLGKKGREIILADLASVLKGLRDRGGAGNLPLNFTRYGKSSVKITTSLLSPGEYGFRTESGTYLFAIEEPKPVSPE